jgi:hypothetical protein
MHVVENEAQPASGSFGRTIHGLKLDAPGAFARSGGLTGTMSIDIADGKHSYLFECTLGASA